MTNRKKDIAVGFVVYNPSGNIIERITKSLSLDYAVYIFDNSPEVSIIRDFIKCRNNIYYTTCGKNLGLGVGLNAICSQAHYDAYSALMYFDQDTIFSNETLNAIEEFYNNNQNLIQDYSAVSFNSSNLNKENKDLAKCFIDVQLARNSGSMFFLEKLKIINWHNDKYFVDGVDYEFCLKSQRYGFRIGEYSCTPGFDHANEQEDNKYILLGKTYSMRAYSWRRIIDTAHSSLKIIITSIYYKKFKFGARIIKLFIIYVITQIVVRFLNNNIMNRLKNVR